MSLTKLGKLALALCLVLGLASTASADVVGKLTVGASNSDIQANPLTSGGFEIPTQNFGSSNVFTATFGGSITDDPAINIAFSFNNLTNAPLPASFTLGPFIGIGFPINANLFESNSGSLGDAGGTAGRGTPDGSVFVHPDPAVNALFIQTNSTETNAWSVNPGFDSTPTPGFTVPFGPFNLTVLNQPGPNLNFAESVSFIVSAGDDVTMTLFSEDLAVPVPPSVLLLGSGLLWVGLFGWRRRLT